jgi:murein DD-endopeptidase MepM/ murein hydrolase activator NlpD
MALRRLHLARLLPRRLVTGFVIGALGLGTIGAGLWLAAPFAVPPSGPADATAPWMSPASELVAAVPESRLAALDKPAAFDAASPPDGPAGAPLPEHHATRIVAVRRGDTLLDILLELGIARAEAHEAVRALSSVYDVRQLKPGQEITFTFAPVGTSDSQALSGAWLTARPDRDIGLARDAEGRFVAQHYDRDLLRELARATGIVTSSLYEAGLAAGVPAMIMVDMIRAFSFDVDFQREIQPGDQFEIAFERFQDRDGKTAKTGSIAFASLTLSGRRLAIYRHVDRQGHAEFFNAQGESTRKALLKTPIDGARLTSGFGNRLHPILGYTALHKGVDFAAPTGTPIQAAGDGVIDMRGWFGGYGNYVRIKHNPEYATAYGHMSRFAPGIAEGTRVRQGQVIGYVGSTGRSTGPHLHYEILRRGAQVNPTGVKFQTGRKLDGAELTRFRQTRAATDAMLARLAHVSRPERAADMSRAPMAD